MGIHQRFGLPLLAASFLLSVGYAAQVAGAALSARDHRWGHALNLVLAIVWFLGAVLDHLGEVLRVPTEEYRARLISKLLEVGIMVVTLVWGGASMRALPRTVRATLNYP